MFAFKKKYRPIRGQKWWEKVLDIITREYPLYQIEAVVCVVDGVLFFTFSFWRELVEKKFSRFGQVIFLWGILSLFALFFILLSIEKIGDKIERSGKKRLSEKVEKYIKDNGPCSYDDLMDRFMPIKIHRGFDETLEAFVSRREIAEWNGIYRLPISEDKRRWHDEDVEIYGISFEELEQVFAHPLAWFGGELRIEFSLWEDEEHRLEKKQNAQTGAELYVCTVAGGERQEFASFEELASAPIFDGKTLREVCDRIAVSYANDFSWIPEFFDINCTYDE